MAGRILIADSIANNRIALKATLGGEYFETLCVNDPDDLARAIIEFKPDIILMATHVGHADGYALCQKLKRNASSAHISVMMYAASQTQIDWGKALVNLVDDMQVYPYDQVRMIARLRQMHRTKVELDTLKTHATATEQSGFSDAATEFTASQYSQTNIAIIDHPANKTHFTMPKSIAHSYILGRDCKPANIQSNTDLIVLQGADTQCQLLSDLKANPDTKSIPVICLLARTAQTSITRMNELGAEDCLLETVTNNHINTRIQSINATHRHRTQLNAILGKRVKEACIDPLTGIYNRRHAQSYLNTCFQAATENSRNLVAMMLDIDKFKIVNDTLGHVNGDIILQEIANRLSNNIRGMDMVARMGGEEFLILIPDASLDLAIEIAERLRRIIEEKPFNLMADKISQKITISIGLSKKSGLHKTASDLVHSADLALYRAKAKGRNCISVSAA